jgi:predicted RNase H-like HicB family nuclease
MIYDVILSKSDNKFIARAKEWPEVMVEEDTREKAIDRIKMRLVEYLTNQIEVIQVEIPLSTKIGNPWLDKFGWFKNDPTFDDLQAEIAAFRQEIDQTMEQLDE